MTGMVPPPVSPAVVRLSVRLTLAAHRAGPARLCDGCRRAPGDCPQLAWARRYAA